MRIRGALARLRRPRAYVGGGAVASRNCARALRSSATLAASVTRAKSVKSDATAKEPGVLYSWNSFSTRSGMVSVRPDM